MIGKFPGIPSKLVEAGNIASDFLMTVNHLFLVSLIPDVGAVVC